VIKKKQGCSRQILLCVLLVCLIPAMIIPVYAERFFGGYKSALQGMTSPYVGYSSIEELDQMVGKKQVSSFTFQSEQCVTYAFVRVCEKLFADYMDLRIGNIPDGKEIAQKFISCGYEVGGTRSDTVFTAKDGKQYKIIAYKDDSGAHIRSNSFVCFNSNSKFTSSEHGHVIYVEEVANVNGTKYVYYTEGGPGFDSWEVRRLTFEQFCQNFYRKAGISGYCGTVTFVPACDHKTEDNAYEIDGRCSSCGAWNTITSTDVRTGCYKVVANKTAYLRVHPYKVSNESIGELLASIPSGTEVEVTGAVINCFNNTWYKVKHDGKEGYIVSSSLEWVKDIVHEHTKGEFQFGEALHPHYKYWKCTGCGELFTDGTTMTSSSCEQCNPPVVSYYLDVNGYFDSAYTSAVDEYGTFDVYINGELVADDCSDYFAAWPAGTSYEIKDIRPREGYSYDGVYIGTDGIHDGFRSGTITSKDSVVALSFSKIDAETIGEPAAQMVFNGHTYLYYDTPVTWYTARQLCEAAGGHLVTVTDEAEQTAIMSMGWHGCVWLGASDGNQEGVWQWVTGEAFQYANWLSGQPDDYQGNATAGEDYLTVWEEGVWNDDCGCSKFGFLCEIDSASHQHELDYIPRMEPTCTEQGQAEAWYCGGCETYFLDSEAQWETTVDELRIAAIGHTVVDGRCENCLECMSAIQNVRWLDGETTVLVDFEYPTPGAQAVCAIYQDGRMIDVIVIPVTESRKTLQFSFGYVECDSIRVLFVDSAFAPLCQSVYETE